MEIFIEDRPRAKVENQLRKVNSVSMLISFESKTKTILNKSINQQRIFSYSTKTNDIFFSQSTTDAALVTGLKLELENLKYSVYIDRIEDPKLRRTNVMKVIAIVLQARIKHNNFLLH